MKLDLGCGQNKKEGFTGVDIYSGEGVDIVHDLFTFPYPFEDNSVEEIHSSHFLEHVPGLLRGKFFNEIYRIMKVGKFSDGVAKFSGEGARAVFYIPYYSSMRAIQDYTHAFPPIAEASFLYFNKGWREQNKLTHYDATCDFDFCYNYFIDGLWQSRNEEMRGFAARNYINAVSDLQVIMVKRA